MKNSGFGQQGQACPGWSKIPEASIPVSILSVSESELVSADRIDT